jgi:hypothetical protein
LRRPAELLLGRDRRPTANTAIAVNWGIAAANYLIGADTEPVIE